ncbi:rod shape-determining protein RodA [Chitinivibrio alkaliphilus]|uniref:Peptidoglycan glycosyltransferase RodA n=1 Tax=Chitinivibrio alkaliphilus ACht1 TaxID=1313304 RepID=U7DAD0_9BACT|nr:rod shape-determining protein RodA [Chitinivibrio alkaliphilus]ERP38987.1 rod shape-determining protein RodA [Chitinivibrio alkaliphilus ACht1]
MKSYFLTGKFDVFLFIIALILWTIGLALVYSSASFHVFNQQILWGIMGILLILITVSIPTAFFYKSAHLFYVVTILLLITILFSGEAAMGAARWLVFGGLRIQPSEFAKIGLLLMLSRYLTKRDVSLYRLRTMIVPAIIITIPFVLVMQQPDLGTALIFLSISLPMFYWAGMSLGEIFYLITPCISLVLSAIPLILSFYADGDTHFSLWASIPWGIFVFIHLLSFRILRPPLKIMILSFSLSLIAATMTNLVWNNVLQDYQKMRVVSFINPQADPRGAGYQVIQSMIALGSGQEYGKGFLQGSQVNLQYLPEAHTDFIFAVLGEQFGLVGSALVLILYLLLIIRALSSTRNIRNRFANILLVGAASMTAFHVIINIAMVVGMMPVTGLPLPFLSYGGSFTLTMALLVGLIMNARGDRANY